MKIALLIFALILTVNLNAQVDTIYNIQYYPKTANTFVDDGYIPYLIGSHDFPQYKIETRTCSGEESIMLPNGRRVAGLSCILFDKDQYVGGSLVFGEDTTIITDITVVPYKEGALFTVKGKEFSMSFTLLTGLILEYENGYATFNTEDRGVWKIHKKT